MRNFGAVALVVAGLAPVMAGAQTYPEQPIKIIVPYAAGGLTDLTARVFAQHLKDTLGQTAVVDNRPGASGTIGTNVVAKSTPDGYTVLVTIGSHTIAPALMRNLPYDTARDLAAVSLIVTSPNVLIARPGFTAKTVGDLVKAAKADPGKLTYSTAGHGTTTHLMMEMLARAAGVSFTHVPFKGSAPSLEAVVGSQVDLSANVLNTAFSVIQAGKVEAVAVAGSKRSVLLPAVPTFVEAGFPAVRADSWIGLFVPAGTPAPIIAKLHQAVVSMLAKPDVKDRFLAQAAEPVGLSPSEFDALVREEIDRFTALAQQSGLKSE